MLEEHGRHMGGCRKPKDKEKMWETAGNDVQNSEKHVKTVPGKCAEKVYECGARAETLGRTPFRGGIWAVQ